jgi:hypothetical protein
MLCLGKLQQQFVSHEKKESGTAQDLQYEMREMGRELGKEATAGKHFLGPAPSSARIKISSRPRTIFYI